MIETSRNNKFPSKLISHFFYQRINQNPFSSIDQVIDNVKRDVLSQLINNDEIANEISRLGENCILQGVINPHLIEKAAGKKPYFIFINAKSGQYNDLQQFIERFFKQSFSAYTLYGDLDNLICVFATPEEMDNLYDFLDPMFSTILVETDSIHTYYGYRVDQTIKSTKLTKEQTKNINLLIKNFKTTELNEEVKKSLIKEGLLLGPTLLEDYHSTDRIQAIIGVSFQKPVNYRALGNFPDNILSNYQHGDSFKKVIRSIYKCNGNYDYLLRVVTDTMSELDHITDLLNTVFDLTLKLETKTFIFAKLREVLPEYTQQEFKVDFSIALQNEHLEWIKTIEDKFIRPLGEMTQQKYQNMEQSYQFELLEALQKVSRNSLHSFSFAQKHSQVDGDRTFITQFTRGYIARDPAEVSSAAATLGGYVENILQGVIQDSLKLIFPAYNLKTAQNDLNLDNTKFDHYPLGKCLETFKKIDASERFRTIGIQFEDIFFNELGSFTDMRNFAAHHKLVGYLGDDFSLWTHKIVDMHAKAAYIFDYIMRFIYKKDLMEKALQAALSNQDFCKDDFDAKDEIIREIRISRSDLTQLIKESNEQNVNRFYAIIAEFKLLSADQNRFEAKANKVIQYFSENEELITTHLNPEQQTRWKKLNNFITKKIPADVFTNLLASILITLMMDPNFSEFITGLIKAIR